MLNNNRIVSWLLCFTIFWTQVFPVYAKTPATVQEIYEKYPNAQVIQVTREEYPALAYQLAQSGYQTAGESGLPSRNNGQVYSHSESDYQPAGESGLPGEDSESNDKEDATGDLNGHEQTVGEGDLPSEGDGGDYGDSESDYLTDGETCFSGDDDKAEASCSDSEHQSAGESNLSSKDDKGSQGDPGGSDGSDSRRSDDSDEEDSDSGGSNTSVGVSGDFLSNFNFGSNNAPAVVFVVIGAIVLVVWTLYAVKYLFDLARDTRRLAWADFVTASSWGSGDEEESLRFHGVKLLIGIQNDSEIGIGLSGEIGESIIRLPGDSLDLRGKYWLLGPMFRLNLSDVGKNPPYLQMEFVAGSTENSEIGLIAQAKMGLNFGLGEHLRWGLNFGALNINLSETEGIIQERSQFHNLVGIELGYRF